MNLRFDQPEFLLLAAIGIPIALLGWRWLSALDMLRKTVVTTMRVLLIAAIAIMLAGPHTLREHDDLTVIGLLDISGSVARFADLPEIPELGKKTNLDYLRHWFRKATQTKTPNDRFGLIVFDGKATVISVPTQGDYLDDDLDIRVLQGTNLAEAIDLAIAMLPADTSKRLVLISDGNETIGSAIEAASKAAAGSPQIYTKQQHNLRIGIPIDVVPIEFQVSSDVQVLRVEAPPVAQSGQTVTLRIVLSATKAVKGLLSLEHEGVAVDINGSMPGTARQIVAKKGNSIHLIEVALGETPINRFVAVFEPLDPTDDVLPDNNQAEAFTSTPSKGSILVLDSQANHIPNVLSQTLKRANLSTSVSLPSALGSDLLSLQRYDLIILDNVAASDLSTHQHKLLSRYVNDLGGGLIMVGGERSFGAGGWNGTVLEEILPLELDPPREARLPEAALVIVMDKSGSMNQPVAGTRSSQQRVANEAAALAIESLRSESLVGVVTFDFTAHVHVPLQRNDNPKEIADKVRGIVADGGTDLLPALETAYKMLKNAKAERKHIVCLSDGRSYSTDFQNIVRQLNAANIKVTTIAIGDSADHVTLSKLAEDCGGKFYRVQNPKTLPRVLVDSVQILNKPLIKEVPFVPVVKPTGSTLAAGMENAPILDGLVITAVRDDPTVIIEMTHPDGEPLLAHWQAGMGRVAAFTSDANGAWSNRWMDWPGYGSFWPQLARTISRAPTNRDLELTTIIKDGRLKMTLDAIGDENGFIDYMRVKGTVYTPDGSAVSVILQQTAPGRYEGSIPATLPGNYVVAISPQIGARQLSPVIGGATQSSNPEYRSYQSNRSLLERIAETTGGRVLEITNPENAELFDRTNMALSVSSLPAWRNILWLALAMFLVDVACRRIAWDYALLRRFVTNAIARVVPSHLRAAEATATLATLRQSGQHIEERLLTQTKEAPRRAIAVKPKQPIAPAETATPSAQSKHSKVAAALAALRSKHPSKMDDEPQAQDVRDVESDATQTTSNLLAAKRRARQKNNDESNSTND